MQNKYKSCTLCARKCGVDRSVGNFGFCKMTDSVKIARAARHMWEEPPLSGTRGSGTIFFSGCSLSCVFCQNRSISHEGFGRAVSIERLSEIMLSLQTEGVHNINFVTPTHFAPSIVYAVEMARNKGLLLPIVYNTSSYDTPETIKMLKGTVDVYLPDLKYYRSKTAKEYSSAIDYVDVARRAIEEMHSQIGECVFDSDGMMTRGIIVRVLLLPGHLAEAKLTVKYLYETYGDSIYISLMNQYTPMPGMPSPLNRRVSRDEYSELCDYAVKIGLKNGFVQELGTADESFIPPFDLSGV